MPYDMAQTRAAPERAAPAPMYTTPSRGGTLTYQPPRCSNLMSRLRLTRKGGRIKPLVSELLRRRQARDGGTARGADQGD